MYTPSSGRRLVGAAAFTFVLTTSAVTSSAQAPAGTQDPTHQHGDQTTHDQHAVHEMAETGREGSGTAWLPDESPMYAVHGMKGPWTLMFHENVFLQFLHESGERGDDQLGSANWVMGMAQRNVGRGRVGFHAMFSFEPWSIGGCGYPDLLATGEECKGQKI